MSQQSLGTSSKERTQPVILVPIEARVLLDPHYRAKSESSLVEGLTEVCLQRSAPVVNAGDSNRPLAYRQESDD